MSTQDSEETISGQIKLTEEKFQKAFYLSILNALPANIALLDSNGKIILVNDAWKSFGDSNQLASKNYCVGDNYLTIAEHSSCMGEINGSQIAQAIREIIFGTRNEFSLEYTCSSSIKERWFQLNVSPVQLGNQPGAVVKHINITERKLAEIQIREVNELLEQKVKERTAELIEANRDMESFSYTVSHDLQGPLRSINGFSSLLLKEHSHYLNDEGKAFLHSINVNVKRMSELIRDLLHFSKLGKAAPEKQEVNMHELVNTILQEIKPGIANFNTQIKLQDLETTVCDPALTKQVWINLIENAVKYSSKKETPVIEIGMHHLKNPMVYYVKDNGVGFDMEQSNKMFGAFNRMHNPEEFEGTGIGLATVYRIVTKHGGKIWAEAKPERGAIFYFTLNEN